MYDVCVKTDGQWKRIVTLQNHADCVALLREAELKGPNTCVAQVGGPISSEARVFERIVCDDKETEHGMVHGDEQVRVGGTAAGP